MTDKIKIAIVGYGNVGKGVHKAIERNPDMLLYFILSRNPKRVEKTVSNIPIYHVQNSNMNYSSIDVAILCGGSKNDLPEQGPNFAKYSNTVDSFDTHADIPKYFEKMDKTAKRNKNVSIISTGWDPGIFSLERVLSDAFIPGAKHYTFWGPGVSQGHSDAIRQVKGVKDAIQYTVPEEDAVNKVRKGMNPDLATREKHWRDCFVVAEENADLKQIEHNIETMPKYFADYDTKVTFVSQERMNEMKKKMPHGGFVIATGNTGDNNKAITEYKCSWGSNPEATGNILVAYARAAYKMHKEGKKGAFTLLDIPASYLSPHSKKELLSGFM